MTAAMTQPPPLSDRTALQRKRSRASAGRTPAMFLHELVADECQQRLNEVNKPFKNPAIVTGFPDFWRGLWPNAKIVADGDLLDLAPGAHDLVIHALALHWANDPIGQMVQCRRALCADGLFLAALFGGQTLSTLRTSLAEAEVAVSGGLSPRVLPMAEIRDLGGLLGRAGLAMPVADALPMRVSYANPWALMHDLRAMGETNALSARLRTPTKRALFNKAAALYPHDGGRITAEFDLILLTGWCPDDSQPKPLRPGSATIHLSEALRAFEPPPNQTKTGQTD